MANQELPRLRADATGRTDRSKATPNAVETPSSSSAPAAVPDSTPVASNTDPAAAPATSPADPAATPDVGSPDVRTGAPVAALPAAPGGWEADKCVAPGRAAAAKQSNTNWIDVGSPDLRLLKAVRQGGVQAGAGDMLFDVGANQGAFALLLAEVWPKATYLLFEMMPSYGELIKKTFEKHEAHDRVRIIPHAVSNVSGIRVPILGDPGHVSSYKGWTGASLLKRGENFGKQIAETTTVALGEWIETLPAAERVPDVIPFVKVDTEGFDGAVLKGMDGGNSMLRDHRTRSIFFELNKMSLSSDFKPKAAFDLLSQRGYDTYLILNDGLFRISDECYEPAEYTPDTLWTRNALALPRGSQLACCVLTAYDSKDRGCGCAV